MKECFKRLFRRTKEQRGYSLAELSISTSIIAMLAVGALAIMEKKNEADRTNETHEKLAKIEDAMASYIRVNKFVPCPAAPELSQSNASFGASATVVDDQTGLCDTGSLPGNDINVGAVPVRTINLPDDYAYDGWDRKFTYRSATNSGGPPPTGEEPYFVQDGFRADIAIVDNKGIHKTNINSPAPYNNGAAYVVISHGSNGKNVAWRKNDSTTPPSQATGRERANTDHTINTYVQADKTSKFDDIIIYGLKQGFIPPKNLTSPIQIDKLTCENAKAMENNVTLKNTNLNDFESGGGTSTIAYQIGEAAKKIARLCKDEFNPTSNINPSAISNLVLWLDADDHNTLFTDDDCSTDPTPADTDSIGCWKDKSGNAKHVTQSTGGSKPVYDLEAIGSKPAITFSGAQSLTSTDAPITAGDDTYTIIAVWESDVDNAFRVVWEQNASSTLTGRRAALLTTASGSYGYNGESNDQHTLAPYATDTSYISFMEVNDGTVNLYHNGTLYSGAINATTGNIGDYGHFVGSKYNGSEFIDGHIGEIAVYDRIINAQGRQGIESYLSDKWDIALSTTSQNFCPEGMTFTKTEEHPEGNCSCPEGQALVNEIESTNACYASAKAAFGSCVAVDTAPDYESESISLTPPPDTGMLLWLDAADCTTITIDKGSKVSAWNDKSPSANNALQSTLAQQPTYVQDAHNERSVVRFDGGDYLQSSSSVTFQDDQTVYFVLKGVDTTASADNTLYRKDGAGLSQMMYVDNSASEVYSIYNGTTLNSSTAATDDISILGGFFESANSRIRLNGLEIASGDAGTNTQSGAFNIGAGTSGAVQYTGDVSEVLMYDRIITSLEQSDIETYLSDKWDILLDPTDNSDLVLWLDASDTSSMYLNSSCSGLTPGNGEKVGCWKDKSNSANNLTQANKSDRPIYRYNSLNGKQTISFDGADSLLSTSSLNFQDQQTLFFVFSNIDTSSSGDNNFYRTEAGSSQVMYVKSSPSEYYAIYNGAVLESSTISTGDTAILAAVYNSTSSSIRRNGVSIASGNAGTNSVTDQFYVGAGGSGTNKYTGNISEFIIYNSVLTGTQNEEVEAYLSDKWGIALP